ncbi:hypothetical protein [Azospirillum halopraeferens]|uniref:hypothetical protein n=1 Tax=Azospirillum halopraeferens TaxID=34010 RepID=UPI0003F605A0|nr:hypothetical protein [Azospirillum halopraeferens]
MFKRYKIHFGRTAVRPGRPERDALVALLKRFVSENGMVGDLHAVHPSGAFGIVEVRCTERLARRLSDMPEVETILEA